MKNMAFIILAWCLSACTQTHQDKIVGKWYAKSTDKFDDVPVISKGTCEYRSDNTFTIIDTLSAVYEEDYFAIGNLDNSADNDVIISLSGNWEIKDNYLIFSLKKTNIGIDISNLNNTEKITVLTNELLITEDSKNEITTYTRIE